MYAFTDNSRLKNERLIVSPRKYIAERVIDTCCC